MNIKQTKYDEILDATFQRGKTLGANEAMQKAVAEINADEKQKQRIQTLNSLELIAKSFSISMEAQARAVIELTRTINNFNNFPLR